MRNDPFDGRVAVITGAASGIGAAMAQAFSSRGARLVLADIDEPALLEAAAELRAAGAEAEAIPTDVTDADSVEALAEAAVSVFGGVHLVCNNAGVALQGPLVEATLNDWRYGLGVNLWGVVHGVRSFVPRLIAQGDGGHVVNTASMSGLVGMTGLGVYCASKFAVVGLTESLARELKPHGIGVSVLCPMVVDTPIGEHSERLRPPELRDEGRTPPEAGPLAGGVISPGEVAVRVVSAIEAGRLYILTHPEQRELLRRRAARLDEACDFV